MTQVKAGRDGSEYVVSLNKDSQNFEYEFLARSLIACSKFAMRYKNSVPTRAPITVVAEEEFERSDQPLSFKASSHSIFFDLLQSLAGSVFEKPEMLGTIVDTLMIQLNGIDDGALYSDQNDGLVDHMVYNRMCDFLVDIVEKNKEDDNVELEDSELKAKIVKLVLRIGLVTGNAQHLLTAAYLQSKYMVNVSQYLDGYIGQSDKFIEPASVSGGGGELEFVPTMGDERI